MRLNFLIGAAGALAGMLAFIGSDLPQVALAQDQPVAAPAQITTDQAWEPLSEEELEVLVAPIALYPDDLIALIFTASLYPLQIVDAARFLEAVKTSPDLKPKEGWDGSVISLLNYPEIVLMMSDDLDWTQAFGEAIAYQQRDVLAAIQTLRDRAMTNGSIQSDDKVSVIQQGDIVVIQPASPEVVYIPQYDPAMLYTPGYTLAPVTYYANPYPSYYFPTAPYFAGVVTGVAFAAVVDWDHGDVWGGDWDGGDIDIDCNHCFNDRDFNGKVKWNEVDWNNVDRSKININKDQIRSIDRNKIKNSVEANSRNDIRTKAADTRKARAAGNGKPNQLRNIRQGQSDGLKSKPGDKQKQVAGQRDGGKSATGRPVTEKREASGGKTRVAKADRPAAKHKAAGPEKRKASGGKTRVAKADRPAAKHKAAGPEKRKASGGKTRVAKADRPAAKHKAAGPEKRKASGGKTRVAKADRPAAKHKAAGPEKRKASGGKTRVAKADRPAAKHKAAGPEKRKASGGKTSSRKSGDQGKCPPESKKC